LFSLVLSYPRAALPLLPEQPEEELS